MKKFLSDVLVDCNLTVSGTTSLGAATGITVASSDDSTNLATTAWVKNQGFVSTNTTYDISVPSGTTNIRLASSGGVNDDITISAAGASTVSRVSDSEIRITSTNSVDYVSNVALNGASLEFTGVGNGFAGTIDLSTLSPTAVVETVYSTVKNVSGGILYKGTPLAVVPGQTSGNISDVVPADASDPARMPAVFILNEDLADEAEGQAVVYGEITGIDTSLFDSGTTVYVGPGGGWTATKPTGTDLIQNLGIITKSHNTNGGGVVMGAGRSNDVPNIPNGYAWVGNASGVATPTQLGTNAFNSNAYIRKDIQDTFTGLVNRTYNDTPGVDKGTIILEPGVAQGSTGIGFVSAQNVNSDYGYIWWYDDNNNYAFGSGSQENAALIIGIQNDSSTTSFGGTQDAVVLESSSNIFFNPGLGDEIGIGGVAGPDFTQGKVYIGRAAEAYEVYHEGNLTNVSQLNNDAGYLTSFTEADTLDTVTGRGATTANAITTGGINMFKNDTNGVINTFENYTGYVLNRVYADYANDGAIVEYQERVGVDGNYTRIGNFSNHPLYLMTGNSTNLTLLTNGNVGVGTTNPSQKLHVVGKGLFNNGDLGSTLNDTVYHLEVAGSRHHLDFKEVRTANGTDWMNTTYKLQMRVDSTNHQSIDFVSDASALEHIDILTGNQQFNTRFTYDGKVGIGDNTPSYKLDVAGDIRATAEIFANSYIKATGGNVVRSEYDSNHYAQLESNSSGGVLKAVDGGSATILLRSYGDSYFANNVGIGTTAPKSKLHVDKAGNSNGGTMLIGPSGSGTGKWSYLAGAHYNQDTGSGNGSGSAGIALIGSNASSTWNRVYIGGGPYEINAATEIQFWTHDSIYSTLGGTKQMSINSAGTLALHQYGAGILTTDSAGNVGVSTAYQTQATADGRYVNITGDTMTGDLTITKADDPSIIFTRSNSSTGNGIIKVVDTGGWQEAQLQMYNSQFIFSTSGGAEQMRLLNNGNLGLGTTNPSTKLHIVQTSDNSGITISSSAYRPEISFVDDATGDNFKIGHNRSTSDLYIEIDDTPTHAFSHNGRLGIGTISPSSALHVVGDARVQGSHTVIINAEKVTGTGTAVEIEQVLGVGAFLDYVIYTTDLGNMRAGTFMVVANDTEVMYTETATTDIGDTSPARLTASFPGAAAAIFFQAPDASWEIKYTMRLL